MRGTIAVAAAGGQGEGNKALKTYVACLIGLPPLFFSAAALSWLAPFRFAGLDGRLYDEFAQTVGATVMVPGIDPKVEYRLQAPIG